MTSFVIEPLSRHERRHFDCGQNALNGYFRQQVSQDVRRQLAHCFVAVDGENRVGGFFTLSALSIRREILPIAWSEKLPRYSEIPAALIGRLAVDRAFSGRGLGAALLADAITRATSSDIAVRLLVVDALDETARAFYEHYGFTRISGNERRLVRQLIPSATS